MESIQSGRNGLGRKQVAVTLKLPASLPGTQPRGGKTLQRGQALGVHS